MLNRFFFTVLAQPLATALLCISLISCSSTGGEGFKVPNDRLIVPGERIGPVALGMSDEALFKLGVPESTKPFGNWTLYLYKDMTVFVEQGSRKVVCVAVQSDSSYRLANGVKVGSTLRDIQAVMGPSGTIRGNPAFGNAPMSVRYQSGNLSFDFGGTTATMADRPRDTVQRIGIQVPGAGLL